MSAGWAGGAAGGPLQAAHPGVGGLPQPLHQLPCGLAQHALVPAPVLLVDGSAPRALRRPQIRWGELAPSTLQYFGQYFYVFLFSQWPYPDCCFKSEYSCKYSSPLHENYFFLHPLMIIVSVSALYYYCYKRAGLSIADPRFYEDLSWVKEENLSR